MQQRELAKWFHDFKTPAPEEEEEEEEEEDDDEESNSWYGDRNEEHRLDLDWFKRDRDVKKHIPKLTTIVLGKIIKTVNYLATSGDLDQLDKLKATIPSNLIPAISSQLSFTALRNFLKLPLAHYFDSSKVQLETVLGCMKQEEDVYRYLYHLHPKHPFLLQTEGQLLLSVFDNYELFIKSRLNPYDYPIIEAGFRWENELDEEVDDEDSSEDQMPKEAKTQPDIPVINNREKFLERWHEMTRGVFQHVDWTNLFAAGGSILHCLRILDEAAWKRILHTETEGEAFNADQGLYDMTSNIEYQNGQYKSTDIDLYIYGLDLEQTRNKVLEIFEAVLKIDPKAQLFISDHYPTVTVLGPTFKPIQIILCLHKSPEEVLLHYDLNCVCVGFNGTEVLCLPKFVLGMKYKMNFLDSSMDTQDKFQVTRVHKYAGRGFSTSLPLHFRMHGYFDQEIPSNEELARDTSHPVYYYLCEILHLAKFKFLRDHLFAVQQGIWRWERFWQAGITIGQRRHAGPKKNNVIETLDREIPLPIDEEQDLVAFTKHLQKSVWNEPPTRYFSVQYYMHVTDFDKELSEAALNRFNRKSLERIPARLNKIPLTVYNESQYLQHFYLNCCVTTKTHTPDLSQFSNPYLGINTSLARVIYDWNPVALQLNNFSDVESGRISSQPFDLCGRKWRLDLESGTGMPIIFLHLRLLPGGETNEAFSSMDQAPLLAANFIIKFRGQTDFVHGVRPRDLALDGSKIFSENSDTWSTYFHGTYISAKADNPLNIVCSPHERSNCLVDNSVHLEIVIQTLTVFTPAIAF